MRWKVMSGDLRQLNQPRPSVAAPQTGRNVHPSRPRPCPRLRFVLSVEDEDEDEDEDLICLQRILILKDT